MKKKDNKLHSDNLKIVKNAGYTTSKSDKRNKSLNNRAGMHDKKKNMMGESSILRRKPLALKHVRRMRKAAAALAAVFLAGASYAGYGFFKTSAPQDLTADYQTVCYSLPTDGSSPVQHTAVEAVGYMNYTLQQQKSWSSYYQSNVHTAVEQKIETFKYYSDGILISADITTSSLINNAKQFCVADGRVLWRDASGGKNSYNGMETPWKDKLSGNLTKEEFKMKRGFPPSEFSVYVINEKTVLKNGTSETAVDNGDGTYSVTLALNYVTPVADGGAEAEAINETSAIYYYQQQMKVSGGISGAEFSNITVKFTFDGGYRVLRTEVNEAYVAQMGISASCKSESITEYSYGDGQEAAETVKNYYGGFFSKYTEAAVEPEDGVLNTAECLAKAFGSVMTEGAVFKLDLQVDELITSGVISLDSSLSDIRVALGDIKAYYGGNCLYLACGNGLKCKIDLNGFSSDSSDNIGFDADALLAQLGESNPQVSEDGTRAKLNSTLHIWGVTVNLEFSFIIEGGDISLEYVGGTVPVGGGEIKARLAFGSAEDIPAALSEAEKNSYADLLGQGLSLSGVIEMNAGGETVVLDAEKLGLTFANGFGLELKSKLYAGGTVDGNGGYIGGVCIDFYISYSNGVIKLVYGDDQNFVGVKVSVNDFATLKEALADVVGRLSEVVCEVVPQAKDILTYDNLLKLLQNLEIFKTPADGIFEISDILDGSGDISGLLNALGIPVENGKISIEGLLNNLNLKYSDGRLCATLGNNLAFNIGLDNSCVSLKLSLELANNAASVSLNGVKIDGAFEGFDCPVDENLLLTCSDLAEMLDYVAATAELITRDEYSANASVKLYENAAGGYTQSADVGVNIDYVKGKEFPVKITLKDNNKSFGVELSDDMYFHLGLAYDNMGLKQVASGDSVAYVTADDLYLDIWILDANPTTNVGGKWNTVVPTADGRKIYDGLDVYVCVSKFKNQEDAAAKRAEYANKGLMFDESQFVYSPLKVYAPLDELFTVLAAGVSMLDLQGINLSEQPAVLQQALTAVSGLLDEVLIKKYLPATHGQFASLGQSLIPQILGKDLSTLLSEILNSVSANGNGGDNNVQTEVKNGNYIKSINVEKSQGAGELKIVLNSQAIYGGGYENTVFTASKGYCRYGIMPADGDTAEEEICYGKSYIKALGVENVYFGGNKKADFALNVSDNAARAESFENYYNFSGLGTFLKAAVNSATHKTTDRDRELAEEMGLKPADYTLNHYYLINGMVRASILGKNIDIDTTLSVNIDEKTNDVTANIHLEYKGVFAYITPAINGDTVLDMTIKDGMLYMKRVQTTETKLTSNKKITPITIYRVMPLSEFAKAENIMDNIGFILNFGSFINDQLKGVDISGGSGADMSGDYGESIGQFLAYFGSSADKNSASWTLAIGGKGLTKLVGMTMEDIVITFRADTAYDSILNSNTYLVTGLEINAKMILLESLGINLTLSGDLKYCNPQENMIKGCVDKSHNLSADWEKLLGSSSKALGIAANGLEDGKEYTEDVLKAQRVWLSALEETGGDKSCIEVNSSSGTGLNIGEISVYEEREKIQSIEVLYGNRQGLISPVPKAPQFEERDGYELRITYRGVEVLNDGTLSVTDFADASISAQYSAKQFTVTLKSEFAQVFQDKISYTYGSDLDLTQYMDGREFEINGVVYTLTGFEYDGKKYSGNIKNFNILSDVTLNAVWGEADKDRLFTVTYLNGENVVKELSVKYGEEIDLSVAPAPVTGYEFTGWNYDGMLKVYCNREVYAEYVAKTYNVNLNLNGYDCLDEAIDAGFEQIDGGVGLTYVYDSGAVTLPALADISGFGFKNYYYITESGDRVVISEIDNITSDLTVYPEFEDLRIHITLTSDLPFTFGGIKSEAFTGAEGGAAGYVLTAHIVRENSAALAAQGVDAGAGYTFLGWWFRNDDGSFAKLDDALDIARPGETVELEIKALWGKATLQSYGTYKDGWYRKYNMQSTVSYEFAGYSELVNGIERKSTTFNWHMDANGSFNWESGDFDGNNQLSYTFAQQEIVFSSGCMNNWRTSATVKFAFGGEEFSLKAEASGSLIKA